MYYGMIITDLPLEVLEKIFLNVYASGGSLKKLTEVCKLFNKLISFNNKLMDKISVNWIQENLNDVDALLASKRNYQRIIINGLRKEHLNPKLMQFLINKKSTVNSLKLIFCEIFTSEFEKILNIVGPKLTKVSIIWVDCKVNKEISIIKLSQLKYVKIFGENYQALNLLRGAENVVEFKLEGNFGPINPSLMPFLQNQKIISRISMRHCEPPMSNIESLLRNHGENLAEISLNRLEIENNMQSYPINLPKLKSLVLDDNIDETHGSTPIFPRSLFNFFMDARNIEVLKISRHPMLAYDEEFCIVLRQMLTNFTKLKKLTLDDFPHSLFKDNFMCETTFRLNEVNISSHFTRHTADHHNILRFLKKHELRNLSLSRILLTEDMVRALLSFSLLKSLTVSDCSFGSFPQECPTNYSLEKLCMKNRSHKAIDGIAFILSRCSNVRELFLTEIDVTTKISNAISRMRMLQKIEFDACEILVPKVYPSVSSIEFCTSGDEFATSTMSLNDIVQLIRENKQLKHLKLPAQIESYPEYQFAIQDMDVEVLEWHNEKFRIPHEHFPFPFCDLLFMLYLIICFLTTDWI